MSIEKQVDVLNKLTQIMHASAHGIYDEMKCEFTYDVYEGGWSIGSKYSFIRNGSSISELLDDPNDDASSLVHQLHGLMNAHTGGNWKEFILVIDPTGKAHTKFLY